MVETAVDDLGWCLGRRNAAVRADYLGGCDGRVLEAFNDAVDSLVTILLRWSVLLMLLQIGATAHVAPEGWPAGLCLGDCVGHDSFEFDAFAERYSKVCGSSSTKDMMVILVHQVLTCIS